MNHTIVEHLYSQHVEIVFEYLCNHYPGLKDRFRLCDPLIDGEGFAITMTPFIDYNTDQSVHSAILANLKAAGEAFIRGVFEGMRLESRNSLGSGK